MSLPPIRLSPLTIYISPTATPDSSSNSSNAATSVNPFERRCGFLPIDISLPFSTQYSLITILETHVAGADRRGQLHALHLRPILRQTLGLHCDIDFADLVRRYARQRQRISLFDIVCTGRVIKQVVGQRHANNVVGHRYWCQTVHLPHQPGDCNPAGTCRHSVTASKRLALHSLCPL